VKPAYYDTKSRAMIVLTYEHGEVWHVAAVRTPKAFRRQGLATSLMQRMCEDADAEGAVLTLAIVPDHFGDSLDYHQLHNWYAKFGFKPTHGNGMLREPRTA
jgi:GNAT superfamily N-acetyltransferase